MNKKSLFFRSARVMLMFCMVVQCLSATPATAAPATQENRVENDIRVVGQPPNTTQPPIEATENIQQAPPVSATDVYWPILNEGFESTFPRDAWHTFDNDGLINGEYYWGKNAHIVAAGTQSAWPAANGANGVDPSLSSYPNNVDSWLVYGPIDLSSYNTATLQFKYWNQSELDTDYFGWYTSSDGITYTGTKVSGDSLGWADQTVNLTPYLGDSSVWIAFVFTSNAASGDDGAFLDNISLAINKVFASDFTSDFNGWGKIRGTWSIKSSSYLSTRGMPNHIVSVMQTGTYSTLNYEAKLKRIGCSYCANRLYIRGTPKPLDHYYGWGTGYMFQYVNERYFSVWKTVKGKSTMLKNWTYYSGIQPNAWNILRVTAQGSAFKYYINGVLVWAKNVRGLPSGRVGIGMYNDYYSSLGNLLYVDWATMDTFVSPANAKEGETVTANLGETVTNWDDPDTAPPAP